MENNSKNGQVDGEAPKIRTKQDVQQTLEAVARSVVASPSTFMHSMILLDHVLRLPNARELFDEDMKDQARDLWLKVKSSGLQLNDPPLLFDKKQ